MAIIIFLSLNVIVLTSSFLLIAKLFKFSNLADSLSCLLILYFSQIIAIELLLGIFGILTLDNVILTSIGILLIIRLLRNNTGKLGQTPFIEQDKVTDKWSLSRISQFIFSIIIIFGLVKIFINLVNPPFGWDSLNYHFTFAVEWLKHGNLNIPITISDDPSPTYYPINGSLYYLWLMLPLKNVFLADLGQVPFFILAFISVFAIAKKIGLSKESSLFTAALFLLIPNFFKQLQTAYVDVMVAALFLVCVNFILSLNKDFNWQNATLYSLSLGLLLGTKTVALPYAAILFIPFIYLAIKKKAGFGILFFSMILITVLGGFSYIRNILETGNPLYPLNFKLFGKTLFNGVMDSRIYRAHFKPQDWSIAKLLFHEGLGVQTLIFTLPAMLLGPLTVVNLRGCQVWQPRRLTIHGPRSAVTPRRDFIIIFLLILPILLYLTYRYLIPLPNSRYLYPVLALGIINGFYLYKTLGMPEKILKIAVFICAFASMTELAKRQELVISIICTVSVWILSMAFWRTGYFERVTAERGPRFARSDERARIGVRSRQALLKITAALIIFILVLISLNRYYIKNEYANYRKMVKYSGFWPEATEAWKWLNENTTANNIAYIGRPVPFPLYGTNFKNKVYYVSVNKTEPAKLHYFKDGDYKWGYDFLSVHKSFEKEGNYRKAADYNIWLNNLRNKRTDFLFIYSLHQTENIEFPMEDKWAATHPEIFRPVFKNNTVRIYEIASLAGARSQ